VVFVGVQVERMGADEESDDEPEESEEESEQQEQEYAEEASEERRQQQQPEEEEDAKPTTTERSFRPKSAGVVSEGNKALMRQGARVEVLAIDPGLRGCWFTASVVTAVANKVSFVSNFGFRPTSRHRTRAP